MTEPEQSIDSLAADAQRGSRAAFDALLALFRERVESWVRIRLGSQLRAKVEVDDVVQETCLRALRSMDGFRWRGEEPFANWLCRIAENVIHEHAGSLRRRPEAALSVEPPDSGVSPSRAERRNERFERLKEALGSLPPDYREVVVLSRLEGVPLKEIARRMERSPNAVSHLLIRAMRCLRERMGDTESLQLPARRLWPDDEPHDEAQGNGP